MIERILIFAFIVVFELFAFAVIGIMLNNKDEDNSLDTSFSYLFEGAVYG